MTEIEMDDVMEQIDDLCVKLTDEYDVPIEVLIGCLDILKMKYLMTAAGVYSIKITKDGNE